MYCPHCDTWIDYDDFESRWNGKEGYQFDFKCPSCRKKMEIHCEEFFPVFGAYKKEKKNG